MLGRLMMLDFGDYCLIEQKNYVSENEMFLYKVITGGLRTNYYRSVPVDANNQDNTYGEMSDSIRVIQCGIDETHVETFRLCDVKPCDKKVEAYDSN